jgi:two-component system, OmpR family, response regulator
VTQILLIDDDRRHSELLQLYCQHNDIEVTCAYDGEQGLRHLANHRVDLVLLDVMLPGRDGFAICREVRRRNRVPVIMLTARGDVPDRVAGLETGADDYIAKPFDPRELLARIHSVLRRTGTAAASEVITFEDLRIDPASREVQADDSTIELTTMEYELLLLLASNPGREFSRDDILAALRGIDAAILTRSVDILVSRLRAKLGDTSRPGRFIQTVWGRGYRFTGKAPTP